MTRFPILATAGLLATIAAAQVRADAPLHRFAALALSPDGTHTATLESTASSGGGETPSRLVIRDVGTGVPIVVSLPCGDAAECAPGAPAWAPDSQHLAVAVRVPGGHSRRVFLVGADGLHAEKLADFDGTVITLRWAKAGRLAALAVADANKEVGATAAGATAAGGSSKSGASRTQRIAIIENGKVSFATPPGLFVYEYDWKPDGSGFVATAAETDNGDGAWWGARLYATGTNGEAARLLYAPPDASQQIAVPRISPDGRNVAFLGGLMSDFGFPGGDVFVLPVQGGGARNLTPAMRATATSIAWDCDGARLVAGLIRQGQTALASVGLDGTAAPLWSGAVSMAASDGVLARACAADVTAAVQDDFSHPPEIVAGPVGKWRTVTHENAEARPPFVGFRLTWKSDAYDISGWLLRPSAQPPTRPLPLIVMPHGGPAYASMPGWQEPGIVRSLLDEGYAVLMPNPRGSFGAGEAFVRANRGDFGGGDLRDILRGIDAATVVTPVDRHRLGITGVSYGGFMTLWATTQSPRFRAAVARAPITDWPSYAVQTGIPGWLPPYFGPAPSLASQTRISPLHAIATDATPTLIAVGAGDIECPPAQSELFAAALKRRGVASELVVYPDEGHEIRDPSHAADLSSRTLAWFRRYLR